MLVDGLWPNSPLESHVKAVWQLRVRDGTDAVGRQLQVFTAVHKDVSGETLRGSRPNKLPYNSQ